MSLKAKDHWVVLRVTALAAIPMCIWLICSIVHLIGADHATFITWLQSPLNASALILFVLITFYHGMLGVHEILEDYVHAQGLLKFSMTAKCLAFFAVGAVCIYSIVKVAFL